MNQLAPLVAPTRHAHGTVTTHKSQMARGTAAPREHPTSTHTAPSWLLDDTLPETGLAFCTPAPWRLSRNTTAARWQRLCGTFVAPHLDAKATKNTCPQRQSPPFFVLVDEAQRMGPLGQIAGEIGHGGILGTKPLAPASKATTPFAATCRVAATRGLVACSDGVTLVPSKPSRLTNP